MISDLTVAVLRGGNASEREVSLRSGAAVFAALERQQVKVLDWSIHHISEVINLVAHAPRPLLVFNMVHGRGGEDGQLQALLDVLDVPYTGSGMLASAIAMDKILTKRIWREVGLPTADYWVVTKASLSDLDIESMPYPLMVKPAREGSSIGMCKVDRSEDLLTAVSAALVYDHEVLLERWICGQEVTVAVLEGQALPVIKLETPNAFYDYDAKYRANNTQYICPSELPQQQENDLKALAEKAFNALNAKVWGRVDMMIDVSGQPWLLELNTVPGMTDHSLVPMAAKVSGLSFDALVLKIIELSIPARQVDSLCID